MNASKIRSRIRKFRADSSGMAAIEIALIAPVFLGLIFATFEAGWIMTKGVMLDRAVEKAVRLVRIGGAAAPATQDAMKTAVCASTVIVPDCKDNITFEMTIIKSAQDYPATNVPCVSKTVSKPVVKFAQGARSDIVYVRVCLTIKPLIPGLGTGLGLPSNSEGTFNLIASNSFVNEPE